MKRRKIVRQMNNAGSTMVEVIVGFVILVMVLAECMVHLLGVSGELVKKSKDMQEEQRILNEEMYRTDTVFESLADTGITLTVDTNKTDSHLPKISILFICFMLLYKGNHEMFLLLAFVPGAYRV